MPRLLVIKGADEGKQLELSGDKATIGRDASNTFRLHDTEVSRRHAEFQPVAGGYQLHDLNSANGTFVNNQRVLEAVIKAGDHIQIGQTMLVYSTGGGETQKEASDLAQRISMISRQDLELSSAIIRTIGETEGSRILAHPERAKTPWLKTALANLTVLYEASQAVSHIMDVNELLERILELVFGSIEADHGCIMLWNAETGAFDPKALRWRHEHQADEKLPVSGTIMEHVLHEKEGVLVSDATQDERFNTGQSITRFGIREVICVPMKGRHETLGVLYLDTHSTARDVVASNNPTGRFSEDHLSLAIAVAHQAALAVEETRYHHAMVQAERLAAVGQTIAALSHHIKNILQGLRSGSDILRMGLAEKSDELVLRGWKIVEKSQVKIYDLVMDMLSYSKEREPVVEPTDLNEMVGEVVELMQGRAEQMGAHLEINNEEDLPLVQVDPEGLHRALLNIVTNALDAVDGRKNPRVVVGTRLGPEPGWVRLLVRDNGTGIPPEKLDDIFKPFVSSKGARGTGLGLAVSRKILREHAGDILVQTEQGKGSLFTLRLPIKSPLSFDLAGTGVDFSIMEPPPDEPEA